MTCEGLVLHLGEAKLSLVHLFTLTSQKSWTSTSKRLYLSYLYPSYFEFGNKDNITQKRYTAASSSPSKWSNKCYRWGGSQNDQVVPKLLQKKYKAKGLYLGLDSGPKGFFQALRSNYVYSVILSKFTFHAD